MRECEPMQNEGTPAFNPALFRDYIAAAADKARASPHCGAQALVEYVEGFCEYYGHKDTHYAFELAVLNIGHTQLGRLLPMFNHLTKDECHAHPGLCEAITIARESLGIRSLMESTAPKPANS